MTTNADFFTDLYQTGHLDRIERSYAVALRDMDSLMADNKVRLGWINAELERQQSLAASYSGVASAADLDRSLEVYKAETERGKVLGDQFNKARDNYNKRWNSQGLGLALARVDIEASEIMGAATTPIVGTMTSGGAWEGDLIKRIEEVMGHPDTRQSMGKGKLGMQQLWKEGVDLVDTIYYKATSHGAAITREEVARAVAQSAWYEQVGLTEGHLTRKVLDQAMAEDRKAYVDVFKDAYGNFTAESAAAAAISDEELTPEQLQKRQAKYAQAQAEIVRLKAKREGISTTYREEDVKRRQAEIYYGKPAAKGPIETMMAGLSDEEKIRFRASLRAEKHAIDTPDLSKDESVSGKKARMMRDMMESGAMTPTQMTKMAADLAMGDLELRDDIIMKFFAWDVQKDRGMQYGQAEAEEPPAPVQPPPQGQPGPAGGMGDAAQPQMLEDYPFYPESRLTQDPAAPAQPAQGAAPAPQSGYPFHPESAPAAAPAPTATAGGSAHPLALQQAYGISPSLSRAIIDTARSSGVDPFDLANLIAVETAGTFRPDKWNADNTHVGLIQFSKARAEQMGLTHADLAAMSPEQQMEYVGKYLEIVERETGAPIRTAQDLSDAVFWPAGLGKPVGHPARRLSQAASKANQGWATSDQYHEYVARKAKLPSATDHRPEVQPIVVQQPQQTTQQGQPQPIVLVQPQQAAPQQAWAEMQQGLRQGGSDPVGWAQREWAAHQEGRAAKQRQYEEDWAALQASDPVQYGAASTEARLFDEEVASNMPMPPVGAIR